MPNPIVKIKAIDETNVARSNEDAAKNETSEIVYKFTVEVNGKTLFRHLKLIIHDQIIEHLSGPVTPQMVDEFIKREVEKIQALQELASGHRGKIDTDLYKNLFPEIINPPVTPNNPNT